MCHPWLTALSGSHHRAVTYEGRLLNDADVFFEEGEASFFPSWGILFGKEKRKVQIKSEGWWLHITELLLQGMEELYSIYHPLGVLNLILLC